MKEMHKSGQVKDQCCCWQSLHHSTGWLEKLYTKGPTDIQTILLGPKIGYIMKLT